MGLEVVLNQILARGAEEENGILGQAREEADRIVSDARARASDLLQRRKALTEQRADALRRELFSAAEFEARRHLLVVRRELSEDFRRRVLQALSKLPAARNQAMLAKLLERSKRDLPQGVVHARREDLAALASGAYQKGRELAMAGGFQLESRDGTILLDCRFETLLENQWRQILTEAQPLFEG